MDATTLAYRRRATGSSLILSPVLTAAGWFVLRPTIGRGPTCAWTVSHVLLTGGWALYLPAAVGLSHLHTSSPMWARWGTALIVLGVPPTLAQFALDLLGAHRATTQADMDAFFGKLLATPMIAIPLYQIGPSVVYVGWLLHAIGLLRTRVVPSWVSVLLIVALLCIASGQVRRQFGLVLAGHIVFGCGSVPLVWYVLTWKEHS